MLIYYRNSNSNDNGARSPEHCTLRDRSLRPLGVGSCASNMLMTSTVTIIPMIFRPSEQLGRAVDASAQVQILTRNVTEQDIPF